VSDARVASLPPQQADDRHAALPRARAAHAAHRPGRLLRDDGDRVGSHGRREDGGPGDDRLVEERGLTREDAYVLTSVAGDLKILEVVDASVWNVSMTMPLDVFAAAA